MRDGIQEIMLPAPPLLKTLILDSSKDILEGEKGETRVCFFLIQKVNQQVLNEKSKLQKVCNKCASKIHFTLSYFWGLYYVCILQEFEVIWYIEMYKCGYVFYASLWYMFVAGIKRNLELILMKIWKGPECKESGGNSDTVKIFRNLWRELFLHISLEMRESQTYFWAPDFPVDCSAPCQGSERSPQVVGMDVWAYKHHCRQHYQTHTQFTSTRFAKHLHYT